MTPAGDHTCVAAGSSTGQSVPANVGMTVNAMIVLFIVLFQKPNGSTPLASS